MILKEQVETQEGAGDTYQLLTVWLTYIFYSFSTSGKAVFLARDKHHLADLSHLIRHEAPYLFQKYVKESHGRDVRVIVVGGRVVGTMLRCSTDGRMQSNCSLGKNNAGVFVVYAVLRLVQWVFIYNYSSFYLISWKTLSFTCNYDQ